MTVDCVRWQFTVGPRQCDVGGETANALLDDVNLIEHNNMVSQHGIHCQSKSITYL